jgi:hypothetical protein
MSEENETTEYMLLFRGTHWDQGVSPEELQQRMSKVMAWFEGLKQTGKVKGGQPLGAKGATVAGTKSKRVVDGPFAESKEAVGGYLLLQPITFGEALEVAKSNPALEYGITIEVRPVLEECPIFERARKQLLSHAAA